MDKPARKGAGFFAIDRRAWLRVCRHGVNAAISYMVICRGAGRDNRTSTWSTNAIEQYSGLGRIRAKGELQKLVENGFISTLPAAGKQRRYFVTPENKDNQWDADWVWLPNSVVEGANGETPPVKVLHQTRNIDAIRMFVNLYFMHHLADSGGVEWREGIGFHQKFERQEIIDSGEYFVWGFRALENHVWRNSPLADGYDFDNDSERASFWGAWHVLENSGLLEVVPHLVTSETDGEILHALTLSAGEPLEKQLGRSAYQAALSLTPHTRHHRVAADFTHLAPVLRHIENVQLVGVVRLKYKPQTKATSSWIAENARIGDLISHYALLSKQADLQYKGEIKVS